VTGYLRARKATIGAVHSARDSLWSRQPAPLRTRP
jgi:hypothetical protein